MGKSWIRYAASIGSIIVGIAVAGATSLALVLELSGFGTPRDIGPRPEYLLLYSVVIIVSLTAPLFIWHRLLGLKNARVIVAGTVVLTVVGLFAIMGLS